MQKDIKKKKEFLSELFYKNTENLKIIAISLKSPYFNKNLWYLVDNYYTYLFENKQKVLILNNKKFIASEFSLNTFLLKDRKTNQYFTSSHNNLKNNELIATRSYSKQFQAFWELKSTFFKENLHNTTSVFYIEKQPFFSEDYRTDIFIVEDIITKNKYLLNYKGQVVMKRK